MEQYFTNNESLKSEFRTIIYKIKDNTLEFTSDLGVFSKDKVDFGSNLLINNYLELGKKNINILDVGCGYGIIGITLAKLMETTSTMVDVNKRAVHLSNMNAKKIGVNATAMESNMYSEVTGTYDAIITNPPIRAGKSIVEGILFGAYDHLTDDGELWIVMRKEQGAKSMMKKLEAKYSVKLVDKSKGFYIIVCKKLLTHL